MGYGLAHPRSSIGAVEFEQPAETGIDVAVVRPVLFRTVRTDSVPLRVLEGLYADAFGA